MDKRVGIVTSSGAGGARKKNATGGRILLIPPKISLERRVYYSIDVLLLDTIWQSVQCDVLDIWKRLGGELVCPALNGNRMGTLISKGVQVS